jgi:hypothetical protein
MPYCLTIVSLEPEGAAEDSSSLFLRSLGDKTS